MVPLCWNSEFVLFVLSAIPQESASHRADTAGAGPQLLGMTDLRALLASSLMELPEPISGAIHDSQRERVAVLAEFRRSMRNLPGWLGTRLAQITLNYLNIA